PSPTSGSRARWRPGGAWGAACGTGRPGPAGTAPPTRRATRCSSAVGVGSRSAMPRAASSASSATGRSAASPPEPVARVLWLTPFPPAPATSAGAGRMFELIRRLAAAHEVDVLSFAAGDDLGPDAAHTLERAGAHRVQLVPRRPDRRPDWF